MSWLGSVSNSGLSQRKGHHSELAQHKPAHRSHQTVPAQTCSVSSGYRMLTATPSRSDVTAGLRTARPWVPSMSHSRRQQHGTQRRAVPQSITGSRLHAAGVLQLMNPQPAPRAPPGCSHCLWTAAQGILREMLGFFTSLLTLGYKMSVMHWLTWLFWFPAPLKIREHRHA